MREIRTSGSEGGVAQTNAPFLPLSQRVGRPVVGAGFTPARMGWRKLQIAQSRGTFSAVVAIGYYGEIGSSL